MADKEIEVFETTAGQVTDVLKRLGVSKERMVTVMIEPDDLANGGALEHAQEMAANESPRTTKLYDRTKERLTQDEVERIRL